MPKIFFTADTHFGCDKTRINSRRPFDSVKEMDYEMISNWNRVVRKDDIVFHLGDFGNHEIIKKLNGKTILIYGEQEQNEKEFIEDPSKFIRKIKSLGFYSQHPNGHIITISQFEANRKDDLILLSHKPSFSSENDFGHFTLFGFLHELQKIKSFGLNVGVDVNGFTPVDEETIIHYMSIIRNSDNKNELFLENIDYLTEELNIH